MSKRYDDNFEDWPLSREEYISAMVHFYRGELTRANTWRLRLDTTTNWAIISTMGLLSFAFGVSQGVQQHSHAIIIIGMVLNLDFLMIEARRYRMFDVWRHRLRMIEENFYGPLLRRNLHSPSGNWGLLVAEDLLRPSFKISRLQAFRARFVRNYATLFTVLLIAWLAKLALIHSNHPDLPFFHNLGLGVIPWYMPLILVICIYLFLLSVVLFIPSVETAELEDWGTNKSLGHITDF